MTIWTEVTDTSTGFSEVADTTNRYVPVGLYLRITTEDDREVTTEDLDYLIIENRQGDITEVGDVSTTFTEVSNVSTSYTEVADV